MPQDRQAKIDRIRRIERIRALELQQKSANAEPSQPAQPSLAQQQDRYIQKPYQSLVSKTVGGVPVLGDVASGAAKVLDLPFGAGASVLQGGRDVVSGFSDPDPSVGALRAGKGVLNAGMGAYSLFNPAALLGSGLISGGAEAIGAEKLLTPVTAITDPQTPWGIEAAGMTDAAIQAALLTKGTQKATGIEQSRQAKVEAQRAKIGQRGDKAFKETAPPKAKELNYDQSFQRARKYIGEQERSNPLSRESGESYVRQASDRIHDGMTDVILKAGEPIKKIGETGATIDGNKISESILSVIDNDMARRFPERVEAVKGLADRYRGEIPITEAYASLKKLNAELSAYYRGNSSQKFQMESARPLIAQDVQIADMTRELIYDKLAQFSDQSVLELRKDYGALKQVKDAVDRQIVSAEKQQTPILGRFSSPTGTVLAVTGAATGLQYNAPATLIGVVAGAVRDITLHRKMKNPSMKRAFENIAKSGARPNIYDTGGQPTRGLLNQAPNLTPPPADISGRTMGNPPYVHYGVTDPRTPKQLPQGSIRLPGEILPESGVSPGSRTSSYDPQYGLKPHKNRGEITVIQDGQKRTINVTQKLESMGFELVSEESGVFKILDKRTGKVHQVGVNDLTQSQLFMQPKETPIQKPKTESPVPASTQKTKVEDRGFSSEDELINEALARMAGYKSYADYLKRYK